MKSNVLIFLLTLWCWQAQGQAMNTELLSKACKGGVVYIETEVSLGTGFLASTKGHVLTNYHVLENGIKNSRLTFPNGAMYTDYKVVELNPKLDIALIRINDFDANKHAVLSMLPTGNASDGTEAVTIGHPNGSKWSTTKGIVSKESLEFYNHLAQIDVPVNPGNSGGPLFNKNGLVIGMVTSRLEKGSVFGRDVQNMNFAITAQALRRCLKRNGVRYRVEEAISDEELAPTMRVLSEEEEKAAKEANLAKIEAAKAAESALIQKTKEAQEELIEAAAEAEKSRIDKEKELEKQRLDQQKWEEELSAQQRVLFKEQEFKDRMEKQKVQAEYERKQIILQGERERFKLEEDKHAIETARLEHKKIRKAYYASLPPRLGLRLGGGLLYPIGRLDALEALEIDQELLSWQANGSLTYRFDINKRGRRGTAVGIFADVGSLSPVAAKQLQQQQDLQRLDVSKMHFFYEWEVGFLVREWLRVSAGAGKQELQQAQQLQSYTYGTGTLGFVLKMGPVELAWNNSVYYGKAFKNPALATQLSLLIHFKLAKF